MGLVGTELLPLSSAAEPEDAADGCCLLVLGLLVSGIGEHWDSPSPPGCGCSSHHVVLVVGSAPTAFWASCREFGSPTSTRSSFAISQALGAGSAAALTLWGAVAWPGCCSATAAGVWCQGTVAWL